MYGDDGEPWAPDLATRAGRRALEARVARAPAVLVGPPRDNRAPAPGGGAPRRPRLVVGVAPSGSGAVVTLDHVVQPDAGSPTVLRRRLALVRVHELDDPALEATVLAWSVLAREHQDLVRASARDLALARRLAAELRP